MRPLVAAVCLLAVASVPPSPLQRFESVEPHMGTLVRVTVYTRNAHTARAAFQAAFDRIRALDRILSDYRDDSELNAVARAAVGRPVHVSDDLFAVLRASQDLAEASAGAFDVTQGVVIRLWREARKTHRRPDPGRVRDALSHGGYRKLHLDARRQTVTLDVEGMQLDVGGIGKGYAASAALEAMNRRGVRSALVAVSGDLAFSAAPPGQRGWRVRVQPEDREVEGTPAMLELTNAAVSTSGNSEQHADVDGRRYSHIVDPSSATALVDDLTVTVIAPQGAQADGLATAVSVLGVERGLALIESRGDAAALIVRRGRDTAQALTSSRFRALATAGR